MISMYYDANDLLQFQSTFPGSGSSFEEVLRRFDEAAREQRRALEELARAIQEAQQRGIR
jgi:uncharacterized protein YukE